jgi:hypothetical protein
MWGPPHPGHCWSSVGEGGSSCLYEGHTYFERNLSQDKTYFGTHPAWLKGFTYHLVPVLVPIYKQHILSSAKLRTVCYSLPQIYVNSVYFNLFGWRGREVHETF